MDKQDYKSATKELRQCNEVFRKESAKRSEVASAIKLVVETVIEMAYQVAVIQGIIDLFKPEPITNPSRLISNL